MIKAKFEIYTPHESILSLSCLFFISFIIYFLRFKEHYKWTFNTINHFGKRFSNYFACYLVKTACTLGHSRTDEYHYDCISSAGELQPIASSGSEMSLAMGAGHSDIDTPTDDPKCWSGPAHSCSNVTRRRAQTG